MKLPYIEAGEIVTTHGVRGEVKVLSWLDSPEMLCEFDRCRIEGREYAMDAVRVQKTCNLVKLRGVDTMEDAQKLRGKTVELYREDISDELIFAAELVDVEVFADGASIGRIKEVLDYPGNSVYVVQGEREYLIPAVKEFILSTDLEKNQMQVKLLKEWQAMRIDILTLFPDTLGDVLSESILGRAQERGYISIEAHQIRDYTANKQNQVDDYPYGGGRGAIMQADPLYRCWEAVCDEAGGEVHTVYLSPCGHTFKQADAIRLSKLDNLILVCGHYEGIDQRFIDECVDEEISLGDFVLTGGEIAAMAVTDAVCRMVPGVLADPECFEDESHFNGLLEYPQYSRPAVWHGRAVPEILLSGNHEKVRQWRRKQALRRTRARRPDMYEQLDLSSKQDKKLLKEMEAEDREQAGNPENMGAGE